MPNVNLIHTPKKFNRRRYTNNNTPIDYNVSIDAVDNPVLYEFNTEIINNNSQYSRILLTNTNFVLVEGDTIEIKNVKFTVRNNPQTQFDILTTNGSLPQFRIFLEDFIQKINSSALSIDYTAYPTLSMFFVISNMNIRANNLSSNYNFVPSDIVITQANTPLVQYSILNANILNRGENLANQDYSVFLDIYRFRNNKGMFDINQPSSADYAVNIEKVATLTLPARTDNKYIFDISKYLKPFLDYRKITLKDYNINAPNFLTDKIFSNYFIRFGEQYRGIVNNNIVTVDNNYTRKYTINSIPLSFVYDANIQYIENPVDFTKYFQIYNEIGDEIVNEIHMLTLMPKYSKIRRTDDILINYLLLDNRRYTGGNNRNQRYIFTYTFNDGTTTTDFINFGTIGSGVISSILKLNDRVTNIENINNKKIIYVNVDCTILYPNAANQRKIWGYEYELDSEVKEEYVEMVWENDFSVLDKFSFEGVSEEVEKVNSDEYNISQNYARGYVGDTSQVNIFNLKSEKDVKINSGFVNKEQIEWLKTIQRTTNLYIRTGEQELKKVKLKNSKVTTNNNDALFNIELTYTEKIDTKKI